MSRLLKDLMGLPKMIIMTKSIYLQVKWTVCKRELRALIVFVKDLNRSVNLEGEVWIRVYRTALLGLKK